MVKNKLHRYIVCIIIFSTVAAGYKIYTKNAKQNKKLYEAIEINDVEAAKEAIDDGANKNSFQSIILTMESISGKPDRNPVYADTVLHADNKIAQYLIEKGANTNYRDRDGISLLMLAAEQGNIKFCKQLIEKGADVGYKRKGESALDFYNIPASIQATIEKYILKRTRYQCVCHRKQKNHSKAFWAEVEKK